MARTARSERQFPPRTRFNWDFWDGRSDRANGWRRADALTVYTIIGRHESSAYAHGYVAGWESDNLDTTSSEPAWLHYQGE